MKTKLITICLLISCIIVFTHCDDNDNPPTPEPQTIKIESFFDFSKIQEKHLIEVDENGANIELLTDYSDHIFTLSASIYSNEVLIDESLYDITDYYENAIFDENPLPILGELTNYYPKKTDYFEINHIIGEKVTIKVNKNQLQSERKIVIEFIDYWLCYGKLVEIEIIQSPKN